MKKLFVYLHENKVGTLMQNISGQILFQYEKKWLSSPSAIPLSQTLPLQLETFNQKACLPFLAGILPEDRHRTINLGKKGTFLIWFERGHFLFGLTWLDISIVECGTVC